MLQRLRSRGLAVAAAILMLGAWVPRVAAVDHGFSEYTYGTNICTIVKDPINFYYHFNLAVSLQMTEGTLNWRTNFGSDQWFSDGAQCEKQDRQRATGILPPKYHTRLNWSGTDASWTASPMHHDDPSLCGDVANSFNSARDYAAGVYQSHGWFATYTYTGNTMAIKQCDGRWTASDGYYVWIH
jgi:hypothetical protein